jgi:dTDP-6-deoxy-L-talose 4-dehydrogenase (NAD+)
MRVAVTGATGFIGRHVVSELLSRGHQVVATSTARAGAERFAWFNQVQYVELDLTSDVQRPYELLGRPEVLVHLAWRGMPQYRALFQIEENLFQSYRFLRDVVAAGLPQLVVAGTCLEYGLRNGELREDLGTDPCMAYGVAKDSLRRMLTELRKQHPFTLQWVRLFYVYGEGQHPNALLPQLERALERGEPEFLMSRGDQLRDFVPVQDAARWLVRIAEQTGVCGIINGGSGQPMSVRALVEQYLKSKGQQIALRLGHYPYADYEPMAFWANAQRLKQVLGGSA